MAADAVKTAPVDSIATVEQLRDRVRDAAARGAALRIAGGGTWLDAGWPVRAVEVLSTRDLAGIVEYVPGDLTLTARAGTALGEIRSATARHGQWLALDPFGSDDGTIGATVATASAGPLATAFGTPRDLALGVELVTGNGLVARGGGRVVKNVAGFDLTRLMTGAWGTLGVITEVSLRLHAMPAADVSLAIALDELPAGLERVRRLLRGLSFTPYACEVVNAPLARRLFGNDIPTMLIRLGGNTDAVRAQRAALASVGAATEIDATVWERLRTCESANATVNGMAHDAMNVPATTSANGVSGAAVFRLSAPPSEIAQTWAGAAALTAACPEALLHAAPARGVVRCVVPAAPNDGPAPGALDALRQAFAAPMQCTHIGERLPAELWPLCAPPATRDPLSAAIKRTFDPGGVLNPGIFGETFGEVS